LIKRTLLIVILSLAGAGLVRAFLLEGVWVASGSMEPALAVGTHYFVNKLVYRLHPPLRGDMIVFKDPVDEQKGLIKRVIAVGGDTVEIRSKQVFLNGSALTEPYAIYKRANERLLGDNMPPKTVPSGHYFVLGDNRDESEDSTSWKDPKTGERIYFIGHQAIQGRLVIP
jgi:signal peptidase I